MNCHFHEILKKVPFEVSHEVVCVFVTLSVTSISVLNLTLQWDFKTTKLFKNVYNMRIHDLNIK